MTTARRQSSERDGRQNEGQSPSGWWYQEKWQEMNAMRRSTSAVLALETTIGFIVVAGTVATTNAMIIYRRRAT